MVDPIDKGLRHIKKVVSGSNHDPCVWRKLSWKVRTHLMCPTGSPTENSHF